SPYISLFVCSARIIMSLNQFHNSDLSHYKRTLYEIPSLSFDFRFRRTLSAGLASASSAASCLRGLQLKLIPQESPPYATIEIMFAFDNHKSTYEIDFTT
ncbi:hypothetical protein, partial [Alteribacillus persepolensis]|uniref:hypothetical protein n=1 Tax=Alteribacillus persepolensis TaxID=568899 RepID=UPI001C313571